MTEASSRGASPTAICPAPDGELRLAAATPRTAAAWTSSGTSHDQRGLKCRPDGAIRMVPVPPVLVAPDGRLFCGTRGGPLSGSVTGRAWQSARNLALGPELAATRLARRPYELRHAALSLWLNAGGDPAHIAARAGHSVAISLPCITTASTAKTTSSTSRSAASSSRPRDVVRACPWKKPAVAPTARLTRTPSAMRPWIPLPARRRPVNHPYTKQTRPETAMLAKVVYPAQGRY